MKRLFGSAKAQAPAAPPQSLGDASAKIDKRVQDLETKIAKCDEDLKRYMQPGRQQKTLAVQTLKRKKMYEQQRDQIMGTQFNVDYLAGAQEQAEVTLTSVEAMKAGQQDLKQRYAQLGGIADIERLMDGMADLSDEIADINEAISASFVVPEGFDEASCEAEFAALEEEMKIDALTGVGQAADARPSYLPSETPAVPLPTSGSGAAVPAGVGAGEGVSLPARG
eukprot:TRINITY_DN28202_c0_g1_i1.p2 TRINITY_DN28202_c0_g1~~TRINITY_DN28202_c0_g1_i1.p2  ORF type:complete len:244 (+),score=74.45 TRINITY_DN28202_c0_g1_i1:63-734(+)